ncbi:hypothetical protein ACMHYB_42740 [Sorangium sp. So ce1128]
MPHLAAPRGEVLVETEARSTSKGHRSMSMLKKTLLEKVAAAKKEIADAESNLEQALGEIQSAPRADKMAVSEVVQEAFTKLRAARTNLIELEGIVLADED